MDAVKLIETIVKQTIEEKRIKNFEDKLALNQIPKIKNLKSYVLISTIFGTISMILFLITGFNLFKENPSITLLFTAIGFALPFFIIYLANDILFEARKRQKEEILCDLLLEASVFCDDSSMEETIKKISEADFGTVSTDFRMAYTEIKKGSNINKALERVKELNKSNAYSRVIDLFLQGYESGASISCALKETAEDLLETQAIIKERQAVMIVTKYTLLISAGIIVPLILGLITGLVSGLNFNSIGEIGLGLLGEQRKALFESAIIGTNIYIIEYALLSSFFLAIQEGNKKNFWIYALILTPFSSALFFIAKSL
jgi:Flp pilus assembly protein TadB